MPTYVYKCAKCSKVEEFDFGMDYQPTELFCACQRSDEEDANMKRHYGSINTGPGPTRGGRKMKRAGK